MKEDMFNMLDLFSGIGGFSLAAHWTGKIKTVAFCEINKFAKEVLKLRFPGIPVFNDITKLNKEMLENAGIQRIDIICGGFPCQPFSSAGKRKGSDDERALFPEMLRLIEELRPAYILAENVYGLLNVANGEYFEQEVVSQLENLGYEVQAIVVPACAIGAPHRRDRVWIVANLQEYRNKRICRTMGEEETESECKENGNVFDGKTRNGTTKQIVANSRCTYGAGSEDEGKLDKQIFSQEDALMSERSIGNVAERLACKTNRGHSTDGQSIDTNSESIRGRSISGQKQSEEKQRCESNDRKHKINRHSDIAKFQEFSNRQEQEQYGRRSESNVKQWDKSWTEVATELCGVDDGFSVELGEFKLSKSKHREEQLKAYGNAIVPHVAYEIFMAMLKADDILLD